MKKLPALLTLILCVTMLASCGGDGEETTTKKKVKVTVPPVTEKVDPFNYNADPSTFFKVETFEKSNNFRKTTVDAMKKLGSIEWVCSKDFKISQTEGLVGWHVDYGFKEGQTYHGLPYANKTTGYDEFARLIKDGKYTDGKSESNGWNDIFGLQCVTSVNYALQTCINIDINSSKQLNPGCDEFLTDHLSVLGDIEIVKDINTQTTVLKNGAQKMAQAYALLKPGDLIFEGGNYNHLRLISGETKVVKNDKGQINLNSSTVTTCEQVNHLESDKSGSFVEKNGYDTTWWLDHTYTFSELIASNYMPLTLKEYGHEADYDAPYIGLNNEIKAETLAKGTLSGTVSSNMPLRYVLYQLLDDKGNVVSEYLSSYRKEAYRNATSNKYNAEMLFKDSVAHGQNYTFRLYGCIAAGEKLLQETNFTYN